MRLLPRPDPPDAAPTLSVIPGPPRSLLAISDPALVRSQSLASPRAAASVALCCVKCASRLCYASALSMRLAALLRIGSVNAPRGFATHRLCQCASRLCYASALPQRPHRRPRHARGRRAWADVSHSIGLPLVAAPIEPVPTPCRPRRPCAADRSGLARSRGYAVRSGARRRCLAAATTRSVRRTSSRPIGGRHRSTTADQIVVARVTAIQRAP